MVVVSLFDGMGCGRIALERLGKKVTKYYASEIDKPAIKTTSTKWPDTIHLGSVTDIKGADLGHVDVLIGCSPCQGFSFAGKGLNFEDSRSALFFEFVRIYNELKAINPKIYFMLENVRMKKEHEDVISRILGIQPLNINSALVSAQNRERLYWTNIAMAQHGLFGDNYCSIPQPADRFVFLKDILQDPSEVDEKYYLKQSAINRINRKDYSKPQLNPEKSDTVNTTNNSGRLSFDSGTTLIGVVNDNGNLKDNGNKSTCIDANYYKGMDNHSQRTMVVHTTPEIVVINKQGDVKPNQDKSGCFTAGGHSGGNHSDMDLIIEPVCVAMRGRPNDDGINEQQLEPNNAGKTNCLTSVAKDNLIVHNMQPRSGDPKKGGTGHLTWSDGKTYCLDTGNTNAIEFRDTGNYLQWDSSGKGYGSIQDRAYFEDSKGPTVDTHSGRSKVLLPTSRIRRLTPIEVCRLQTVDDEYFMYPETYVPNESAKKSKNDDGGIDDEGVYIPGKAAGNPVKYKGKTRYFIVSDSQIYKMCGNGWNVETICHILSYMEL